MEKKKILLVEDEKILLDLYAAVLLRQGREAVYEVARAESSEQAWAIAAKRPFDLVITDYHLPGEDGIGLIRKVKAKTPGTAFILISGYLSPEIQKSALQAGAYTCLKKPCSIGAILETVEQALLHPVDGLAASAGADALQAAAARAGERPAPVSFQERLEALESGSFFIDQDLRVLGLNARFSADYAPLKDYAGGRCFELLYDSPLACPRCPLHAGKLSGPALLEQKLRLGEEIIERIEPWPENDGGAQGFFISLIPHFPEEGVRPRPAPGKRGQAVKDFFILALDPGGRIVYSDDHFPRLLRLAKADVLTRPIGDFLYSYFRHYLAKQEMDFIRFASLNGERSVTLDFVAGAEKERRPFVCEFIRRDGGFPADWEMLVIGMDMEKRLELHRLIEFERESAHRLRYGQFDMVITIDKDFRIKTINNACLAKLDAKHRDLVDADFVSLLARGRDRQSFTQGIAQAQTLKDVYNLRLDLVSRDRSFPALVNISAVRDSFNDEIGYVLVLRDIERQLKMEATLRHVERMQALGQLAAGTAHQINNYTNAILGGSDLLADCVTRFLNNNAEASEEARGVLKIIQESTQKLTALTRHLTAFARAQQPPVISAGDVNQVVADTLALVQPQLAKKSVELETALTERLPPVYFSPLHLEQAVLNIIMNAVDAVEAGRGRIRVSTFREPEWVCIRIADNGPGIPAEIRDRMFEAFITTKPAGVGTGLGLNVARDVVESAKGVIDVETGDNRGTSMTIKIPILPKGSAPER